MTGTVIHFEKTGIRKKRAAAHWAEKAARRLFIRMNFSRMVTMSAITPMAPVALSFITESLFPLSLLASPEDFDCQPVERVGEAVQIEPIVTQDEDQKGEACRNIGRQHSHHEESGQGGDEPLKGTDRREEDNGACHVFLDDVAFYPDWHDGEKLKGEKEAPYQLTISSVTPASSNVAISV